MKRKLILFALALVTLLNCSDEIEFNTPAVQGYKNGELWKAEFYAADIDFGGFVIEGGTLGERVQLITTNDVRGTFELGLESGNVVWVFPSFAI